MCRFHTSIGNGSWPNYKINLILQFTFHVYYYFSSFNFKAIFLSQIEKYMLYILKSDELFRRLSKEEITFTDRWMLLSSCLFSISLVVFIHYFFLAFMFWCRCRHDMKKHFDESVLSKLPNNYQDILRQSITSEEDDMGTQTPSK